MLHVTWNWCAKDGFIFLENGVGCGGGEGGGVGGSGGGGKGVDATLWPFPCYLLHVLDAMRWLLLCYLPPALDASRWPFAQYLPRTLDATLWPFPCYLPRALLMLCCDKFSSLPHALDVTLWDFLVICYTLLMLSLSFVRNCLSGISTLTQVQAGHVCRIILTSESRVLNKNLSINFLTPTPWVPTRRGIHSCLDHACIIY